MPTDTARTRAEAAANWYLAWFKDGPSAVDDPPEDVGDHSVLADKFHEASMAGAAAQLAESRKKVEALKLKASRRGGDIYAVQPLMQVLEALRRPQDG